MIPRAHFQPLVEQARLLPALPAAFVYPCDGDSLQLAISSAFTGTLAPVLVGPEIRIRDVAGRAGIDIVRFPIDDTADDPQRQRAARRRPRARRHRRRAGPGQPRQRRAARARDGGGFRAARSAAALACLVSRSSRPAARHAARRRGAEHHANARRQARHRPEHHRVCARAGRRHAAGGAAHLPGRREPGAAGHRGRGGAAGDGGAGSVRQRDRRRAAGGRQCALRGRRARQRARIGGRRQRRRPDRPRAAIRRTRAAHAHRADRRLRRRAGAGRAPADRRAGARGFDGGPDRVLRAGFSARGLPRGGARRRRSGGCTPAHGSRRARARSPG